MSQFVGCHNYSRKASSVLNDSHRVDFFQPFVDNTGTANISETCGTAVTFTVSTLPSTHVQSVKVLKKVG